MSDTGESTSAMTLRHRLSEHLTRRLVWAHPALRVSSRLTFSAAMMAVVADQFGVRGLWRFLGLGLIAVSLAIDGVNLALVRRRRRDPDWRPSRVESAFRADEARIAAQPRRLRVGRTRHN